MLTHPIFSTKTISISLCGALMALFAISSPASAQIYDYDVSTSVAGQYAQRAVSMAEAGQCEEAREAISMAQENWNYVAVSSPDQTINQAISYVTYRCGYEPGNIELAVAAKQYAAKAISLAQNGRCDDATNTIATAHTYWQDYQASRSFLPSTDQTVTSAMTQVVSICVQQAQNPTAGGTTPAAGTEAPVVTASGTVSEQAIALAKRGKCPEAIELLDTAKTSMSSQDGKYVAWSSSSVSNAVAEVRHICVNYIRHTPEDQQGSDAFAVMQNAENAMYNANIGKCDEARTYLSKAFSQMQQNANSPLFPQIRTIVAQADTAVSACGRTSAVTPGTATGCTTTTADRAASTALQYAERAQSLSESASCAEAQQALESGFEALTANESCASKSSSYYEDARGSLESADRAISQCKGVGLSEAACSQQAVLQKAHTVFDYMTRARDLAKAGRCSEARSPFYTGAQLMDEMHDCPNTFAPYASDATGAVANTQEEIKACTQTY